MTQRLSVEQIRAALMAAAQTVIDHQSVLTKADQAIGDGDHGLGMARGFTALREALSKDRHDSDAASLFKAGGHAIMMTSGGASGVIFGSFFIGCSNFLRADGLDARAFASALAGGLDAVRARGKANPGDKTMVDALLPAVEVSRVAAERGELLGNVAAQAAQAAKQGLEATKSMIAMTGKAKSLGARSLGFVDPGALTLSLFLSSFADEASRSEDRPSTLVSDLRADLDGAGSR